MHHYHNYKSHKITKIWFSLQNTITFTAFEYYITFFCITVDFGSCIVCIGHCSLHSASGSVGPDVTLLWSGNYLWLILW